MQEQVWKYTVRVTLGGDESPFTGILLQSKTSKENRHLLVNMHSFQEDDGTPLCGFPPGHDGQFKKIPGKITHGKKKGQKRKRSSDPISIQIERVRFDLADGTKTERLEKIYGGVIGPEDIILCDGPGDALVLFDQKFPGSTSAPVYAEISRSQSVHLFGFAPLGNHRWFCVAGEVQSIDVGTFLITCPSVPGLSGGAVVCDGTGGVIGYCGGGQGGSDGSFFGAYAFRIDMVMQFIEREFSTTKRVPEMDIEDSPVPTPASRGKKRTKKKEKQ